jgi:ATP/maltotriose-dependent transcriptional regulator MalT
MGGSEREVMSQSFLANANSSPYEHPSIVVVGGQLLLRSCLAHVLKTEFQDFAILEIETAQQFDSIVTKRISLIMVDVGNCPLTDEGLQQNLAQVHRSAAEPPIVLPTIVNKAKVAFTTRERQVLATLLRGMSNKVIASELNLSQNTVKSHISRIMHKLHAKNRTEAVILSQFSASAANGGETNGISDA